MYGVRTTYLRRTCIAQTPYIQHTYGVHMTHVRRTRDTHTAYEYH